MPQPAGSLLSQLLERDAKPAVYEAVTAHQPSLHPVTLAFSEPALERDYLDAMHRETENTARFGILLALVVYLLFGAMDLWVVQGGVTRIWATRGVVLFAAVLLYLLSFSGWFHRHRELAMTAFAAFIGLGLTAILSLVPAAVVNQYYVGYLLIVVAAYTVFGLRFVSATLVSLLLLVMLIALELAVNGRFNVQALSNATFALSTTIISAVGGYVAERQRRLAHFRLRVIERDRAWNAHSALHDPLTGLANRRLLLERLAHAAARDRRFHTRTAVLFLDLDTFKSVNDRHGHAFGDALLKCVAERLLACVRETDTVARMGGDEFVVLLEDLVDTRGVGELAERIERGFGVPCVVDGTPVTIGVSIGSAVHPGDGESPRALLEAADRAMYSMKRRRQRTA